MSRETGGSPGLRTTDGPPSLSGANGWGGSERADGMRFSSSLSWTDDTTDRRAYTVR